MHEVLSVLQDERARVKEQQDGAYHRMQALKQQSKGKKDAYYQNRRFSQEVLHSWHACLTLLHGKAGSSYLEGGGLTITSFVFVSVPLGPYSVRAFVPWLQQASALCSPYATKCLHMGHNDVARPIRRAVSNRLGHCCCSCKSKAAVIWAVTTWC